AVLLRRARHGGDVVPGRVERGGHMPADESGRTGHKDLHVCSKPIGWSSFAEQLPANAPLTQTQPEARGCRAISSACPGGCCRRSIQRARMQAMGSRRVTRSSRLAWDGLIELYGDEDQVRKLVAELRKAPPTGSDELVALV